MFGDLRGQLAGWRQHEAAHGLGRGFAFIHAQQRDQRQPEGGGLAGAGLGQSQNVVPVEGFGDGAGLNGGRLGQSQVHKFCDEPLRQAHVGEISQFGMSYRAGLAKDAALHGVHMTGLGPCVNERCGRRSAAQGGCAVQTRFQRPGPRCAAAASGGPAAAGGENSPAHLFCSAPRSGMQTPELQALERAYGRYSSRSLRGQGPAPDST